MRVAFITFEYPPFTIGGAGSYADDLVRELVRKGLDVVVITPGDRNERTVGPDGVTVRRIGIDKRLPFYVLQFWVRLPRVVKEMEGEGPFDVVHINDYYSYAFIRKRLSNVEHVLTVHHLVVDAIRMNGTTLFKQMVRLSGEDNVINRAIERRAVKRCDRIVAVSKFTKDRLLEEYGLEERKVSVIGEAIDLTGYELSEDDAARMRSDLDVQDRKVILFVGRVADKRKGLDILLRAFKDLPSLKECALVVVGGGDQDVPRRMVQDLGISEHVRFTGFLDLASLKRMFCLCDVFVSPSRLEGFGLTILQAMAAGKPIVATDVGDITEIMVDGVNGVIIRPDSPSEMTAAIRSLIADDALAEEIGRTNSSYVRERYSWDRIGREFEEYYGSLIRRVT